MITKSNFVLLIIKFLTKEKLIKISSGLFVNILLVFNFKNCNAQIYSTYSQKADRHSITTICFENNGTFKFVSKAGMAKFEETGKYKLSNDTIVLNTDVQKEDFIKVKQWSLGEKKQLYFSFRTISGRSIPTLKLMIDDTFYNVSLDSFNAILTLKDIKTDSFKIKCMMIPWQVCDTNFIIKKGTNVIEILIDDTKGFRRAFLKNEKFIYSKYQIYPINDKEDILSLEPNVKCN